MVNDAKKPLELVKKAEAIAQRQGASLLGAFILVQTAYLGGTCARSNFLEWSAPVALSREIGELETRALLRRRVPQKDRRHVSVELTERGWNTSDAICADFQDESQARRFFASALSAHSKLRAVAQQAGGISDAQARCLIVLSSEPHSSSHIASSAGIARTTAAMALESLVKKGLASKTGGRPAEYSVRM